MGCGHGATPATATTAATAAVGLERRTLAHDGGLALDAVRPACNGIMWVYQWEARQTCTFIVFLRPPPLGHGMAADSTPTPTATSPRRPPGQRRPRRRRQRRLDGGTRNSDSLGRWPRLPALIDSGHRSQFTETLAGAHPIVPSFQKRLAAAGMPCTHRSRVPTARSLRDAGLACGAFVNRNFVRLCSLGPDAFLLVRNAPASTRRRLGHRFKHSPRRGPSEVGT